MCYGGCCMNFWNSKRRRLPTSAVSRVHRFFFMLCIKTTYLYFNAFDMLALDTEMRGTKDAALSPDDCPLHHSRDSSSKLPTAFDILFARVHVFSGVGIIIRNVAFHSFEPPIRSAEPRAVVCYGARLSRRKHFAWIIMWHSPTAVLILWEKQWSSSSKTATRKKGKCDQFRSDGSDMEDASHQMCAWLQVYYQHHSRPGYHAHLLNLLAILMLRE